MASGKSDIIARLALNAEAFSASHGEAFRRFEDAAKKAGGSARASFSDAFKEIATSAQRALELPSLDGKLNLDVAGLRAQADAAHRQAAALREIATAAERAALAQDHVSDEAIALAQASAVAATRAEEHADDLRRQAIALDGVQHELEQTTNATKRFEAAGNQANVSAGAQRAGMQQLSYQLGDMVTMWSMGAKPMQIFASQGSQVIGAIGTMTNSTKGFIGFLGGPWGQAITAAAIITGTLVGRLSETSDNADRAAKSTDFFAAAASRLSGILDLQTGKLKGGNEVLRERIRLNAIADRRDARQALKDAAKELSSARLQTDTSLAWSYGGDETGMAIARASSRMRPYQNQLDAVTDRYLKAIAKADPNDPKALEGMLTATRKEIEGIGYAAGLSEKAVGELTERLQQVGEQQENFAAAQATIDAADGKKPDSRLLNPRTKKPPKPKDNSRAKAAAENAGLAATNRFEEIISRFRGDPTQFQAAQKALNQIDETIQKLDTRKFKPIEIAKIKSDADEARQVIRESLEQPFHDLIKQSREREAIDALIVQGRYAEADALRTVLSLEKQMGTLRPEQLAQVLKIAKADEARARAIEEQRRQVGLYVQTVGDLQSATEQLLSGGSVKQWGANMLQSFRSLQSRIISEKLFGGLQREIENFVTGRTGVAEANHFLSTETHRAGKAAGDMADKMVDAAARMSAIAFGPASVLGIDDAGSALTIGSGSIWADMARELGRYGYAANDNGESSDNQEIVVTARRTVEALDRNSKATVTAASVFNHAGQYIAGRLTSLLGVPDELAKKIGSQLGNVLQSVSLGSFGGSLAQTVFGGKQSGLGSMAGGVVGKELLGGVLSNKLGDISSKLAGLGGPLGSIIGGVAGSLIGGLFKKTKYGAASISMGANGELTSAVTGRGSAQKSAASGAAGNVISGVEDIAEALGAKITGSPNISIGTYNDNYRVSTTGSSKMGGYKGSASQNEARYGLYDFGQDQGAAVAFAVQKMVEGSVITGISQASVNIIKSGQDLQKAIRKASLIESIPKELKKRLDPLGAAMDEVNDKWEPIIAALKEGAATAEQFADAQKLYNMEMAEAKASAGSASEALKSFLSGLNAGGASPLSLTDQQREARAVLDPFLSQINKGETIDQEKYQAAAQTFLDIERQLYGSTAQFFEAFDMIRDATGSAIASIDNATPISTASDLFNERTAAATQATAASNENILTVLQQISAQLASSSGGAGSDYIGTLRNYA